MQLRLADRNDMPIIFIAGHADVAMTVRAMKAGAAEFLTKPFRNDVLLGGGNEIARRSLKCDCYDSQPNSHRSRASFTRGNAVKRR